MNRNTKPQAPAGLVSSSVHCVIISWLALMVIITAAPVVYSSAEAIGAQSEFQPALGIYTYSVKWGQTRAARATVSVNRKDDFYRIEVDLETTKSLSWIYKLNYRGEGILHGEDLKALTTVLDQQTRKRKKRTEITYDDSGEIKTKITKSKKKQPPATQESVFQAEGEVFDVFSSVFLVRRFEWDVGESQQFEVFTGKKRHMIRLICTEKTVVEEGDIQLEAWVIRPSVSDPEKPDEKPKLTDTKIYLSADPYRDLLKIKSKGKFGTIRVKVKSYTPFQ